MNDDERLRLQSNVKALAGIVAMPLYGVLALAFALIAVVAPLTGLLLAGWQGPSWWWLIWSFVSLCISIRNVVGSVRMINDASRREALSIIGWSAVMVVTWPAWYIPLFFP